MATKIVGILNCTPDSFSDSNGTMSYDELLDRGSRMVDEGADIIDIGGDSTRPGSSCPGIEEEWRRISPIIEELAKRIPVSVDTHHSEVARRALNSGASFINDISGQRAPEMLETIARSNAAYIFMFNPHGGAHRFDQGVSLDTAVTQVSEWIQQTIEVCVHAGIESSRLIADPGMGAFLSADPLVSWSVVENFGTLPTPRGGALLGCSRKGFLKLLGDHTTREKDHYSARVGAAAVRQLPVSIPTYLRVHNVVAQRDALEDPSIAMPDWRTLESTP
jgi:dihydropteroate synthase